MPFLERAANVSKVADTPVIDGEQQVLFVGYAANQLLKSGMLRLGNGE
jgi:hypothetical protein